MRNFMRWSCAALATSLALAVSMPALALPAETRLVVPGGTATTTKILPGATAMFEVRIDAPAVSTVGTTYRLIQTSPVIVSPNFFFSITGRSIAGSPYNDPIGCCTDAQAIASPGNRLDPDNDVNLGKSTPGRVPIAPANNILATTITLTSEPTTPLGTYRVQPTVGSTVTEVTTDPQGVDWPMNQAFFDIVVGQTLTVTKSGAGTGTVTADSGAISCGAICSDIYPGTAVVLTAAPAAGSVFTGWSGTGITCPGTGTCTVTVDAAKTVNAIFGVLPPPTLNKAFGAGFALGGSTTLTFTITNATLNNPAQVFSFTDTLPSGLQVAATPGLVNGCSGGTITAAAGSSSIGVSGVTVGASTGSPTSCTISVNVTNKPLQVNASCGSNPAAFTNAGATNTTGVNNISGLSNLADAVTQSCVTVTALVPSLNKAFSPSSFAAGGSTTLTFTITNPATSNPAQVVSFTDTLPSGLRVAATPSVVNNCTGGTVTAIAGGTSIGVSGTTVGASGATATSCTIAVNVTNAAGQLNPSCTNNPAAFTNAGTTNTTGVNNISGRSNLNDAVTQSCVTVTPLQPTLTKAFSPGTFVVNGFTTLTFTVSNPAGNPLLSNVGFTDNLPSGLQVAAVPAVSGTCANAAAATTATAGTSTITVALLQVPAGAATCTVTVNVTNKPQQANPTCPAVAFTNGAGNVTVNGVTNGVTDSCVTVTALRPTLNKAFSPTTFLAGGSTTLTFTITNPAANNPAQVVSFTDTLPSGLQVAATPAVATTCSGGTVTAVAGSGSVAVAGTAVGASTGSPSTCTVSVNVTNKSGQGNASCANNPAAFTNAGATNTTGVNNISGLVNLNDAVTQSCVTVTGFTFSILKTASASTLVSGNALTFTIAVTNNGPDAATNSLLTDPAVTGFNATGVTCTGGTNGAVCPVAGNVTLANLQGAGIVLPTFPASSTITFQLTGQFALNSGSLTNTATIATPVGVPVQTQSSSATVSVQPPAPTNIPTLSEWMLALLALMIGGFAMHAQRRRSGTTS